MARLRSTLLVVTASILIAVVGVAAFAGPSGAQAPTTTVVPLPAPAQQAPSIIPLPNSGHEPVVEGDPGSFAQYAVLFGTMGSMVLIALLVRRESKKKAANKTPVPPEVETKLAPKRQKVSSTASESR
jgi:hypothetical protein